MDHPDETEDEELAAHRDLTSGRGHWQVANLYVTCASVKRIERDVYSRISSKSINILG